MLSLKCSRFKFNNKKCHKDSFMVIKNNSYCLNHSLLLYNKYVLIIQKNYRGHRGRRYLRNIFYKLPPELQELVIYYINDNHYKKKYLYRLTHTVINNTFNLHNYKNSDEKLSIKYLYNCYKLYYKYHLIVPINYLKHAYILAHQILSLCDILLNPDEMVLTHSYYIFEKILLLNLDENEISNLVNMIYKFSSIYSLNNQLYYRNQYNQLYNQNQFNE